MQDPKCRSWSPVPSAINAYSQLRIAHFSDSILTDPQVLCLLVADWAITPDAEPRKTVWRLGFSSVAGYRHTPLGKWNGASALSWPANQEEQHNQPPATWEIIDSNFILQCIDPFISLHLRTVPQTFHHWVIVTLYSALEIVARTYQVDLLDEDWPTIRERLNRRSF